MLPELLPIWEGFARLSRGRNITTMGTLCPITFRDVWDMSQRLARHVDLPAETIEALLTELDDLFLAWSAENDGQDRNIRRD